MGISYKTQRGVNHEQGVLRYNVICLLIVYSETCHKQPEQN